LLIAWGQHWTGILLPNTSCIPVIIAVCHCAWLVAWDGVLANFLPGAGLKPLFWSLLPE
jgi:hypothetical protein